MNVDSFWGAAGGREQISIMGAFAYLNSTRFFEERIPLKLIKQILLSKLVRIDEEFDEFVKNGFLTNSFSKKHSLS